MLIDVEALLDRVAGARRGGSGRCPCSRQPRTRTLCSSQSGARERTIPAHAVPWPQRSPSPSSTIVSSPRRRRRSRRRSGRGPTSGWSELDAAVEDADANAGAGRAAQGPLAVDALGPFHRRGARDRMRPQGSTRAAPRRGRRLVGHGLGGHSRHALHRAEATSLAESAADSARRRPREPLVAPRSRRDSIATSSTQARAAPSASRVAATASARNVGSQFSATCAASSAVSAAASAIRSGRAAPARACPDGSLRSRGSHLLRQRQRPRAPRGTRPRSAVRAG